MKHWLLALSLICFGSNANAQISSGGGCPGTCTPVISGSVLVETNARKAADFDIGASTKATNARADENAVSTTTLNNDKVPYINAAKSVDLGLYGLEASSGVFDGASGLSVTYGVSAGSANISGSVGIGTTSPGAKLDVNGDTALRGAVTGTSSGTFKDGFIAYANTQPIQFSQNAHALTIYPDYTAAGTNQTLLAASGLSLALRTDGGNPLWIGNDGHVAVNNSLTVAGSTLTVNAATYSKFGFSNPSTYVSRFSLGYEIDTANSNQAYWDYDTDPNTLTLYTGNPIKKAMMFDHSGNASFWGPVTVAGSSLTVTGAFQAAGTTFTVANSGIISAPSQPYLNIPTAGNRFPNNAEQTIFFSAPAAGDDTARMWGGTSSSNTFTVTAGGAGIYLVSLKLAVQINASRYLYAYVDGTRVEQESHEPVGGNTNSVKLDTVLKLSAGQVVDFRMFQNSGSDKDIIEGGVNSSLKMVKLW